MQWITAFFRNAGELVLLFTAAPVLVVAAVFLIAVNDLLNWLLGKIKEFQLPPDEEIDTSSVSVVIPTWNGRTHLERNLPSVLKALDDNKAHEVIVVDNASTDGTREMLQSKFPRIKILSQTRNLGFGEGANAGFRAARRDIVILLNNDMRVQKDFLMPLLRGFQNPKVFAVSAQIFFSDPDKTREETGLTRGRWRNGRLAVGHVIDHKVQELFPIFYAGGGSSAYHRQKFLTLGGFDPLWQPFYLEDTDISYNAWKHGWIVLYQPSSIVHHDHRGTIGEKFSESFIENILDRNYLLFAWKNIHCWRLLGEHFIWLYTGLWLQLLGGRETDHPNFKAFWHALCRFWPALRARNRCSRLADIDDIEAFRRPLAGYFRDRFHVSQNKHDKLNVLFVSPYPIEPPLHGGALFMNQTVRHLALLTRLHLLVMLDTQGDLASNKKLEEVCASAEFFVRQHNRLKGIGYLLPHAVREFENDDFYWRLHRTIYIQKIDVLQLEYTQLASYGMFFRNIATFLFEHDIYFQSIASSLRTNLDPTTRLLHFYEYLRALRFELKALRLFDGIQTCTVENRRYLESFIGHSMRNNDESVDSKNTKPVIRDDLRAAIDLAHYRFVENGRQPDTLLFIGSFQHPPNRYALSHFIKQILPIIHTRRSSVRLLVAGAQAPSEFIKTINAPGVEFLGCIEDIRQLYATCSVFVCPILSGSGIRVKLLEAFAIGIPAVSTTLGAEGLTANGDIIEIAESPEDFATAVISLLENPNQARAMARRARGEVEQRWSVERRTEKLEQHYRKVLQKKLSAKISESSK